MIKSKDKLKYTLNKYDLAKIKDYEYIDLYNLSITNNGCSGAIHTRISAGNYWYVIKVVKIMNDKYWGVYDYKESDTFRPTQEERIHKDYSFGKTITCRSDSCCVIMRGGIILWN